MQTDISAFTNIIPFTLIVFIFIYYRHAVFYLFCVYMHGDYII